MALDRNKLTKKVKETRDQLIMVKELINTSNQNESQHHEAYNLITNMLHDYSKLYEMLNGFEDPEAFYEEEREEAEG